MNIPIKSNIENLSFTKQMMSFTLEKVTYYRGGKL